MSAGAPSRGLSRRRVRSLLGTRRYWRERDGGRVWLVRQIWRADGHVLLVAGAQQRVVPFGELGRRYEPAEDEQVH